MPETLSLPIRLILLIIGISIWLTQYFFINNITQLPRKRVNTSISFDKKIPFIPESIIIYLSTYIFGILPFVLISNTILFLSTIMGYVIVTVICGTIHVLYPSKIQRHENTDSKSLSWLLITWFQSICKPYGNFPSTHVAFAVLSVTSAFITFGKVLGGIFLIWASLIALSTLTTKQHYLLDIFTGCAIGIVAAILMFILYFVITPKQSILILVGIIQHVS